MARSKKSIGSPDTGLMLLKRCLYGSEYEWCAYPVHMAHKDTYDSDEEITQKSPRSFSDFGEHRSLYNFYVSIRFYRWSEEETGSWSFSPHYELYRLDRPAHALECARLLTKLEKGMQKLADEFGPPITPGHYLLHVCKVLGLDCIVTKRSSPGWDGSLYDWRKPAESIHSVNTLLEEETKRITR